MKNIKLFGHQQVITARGGVAISRIMGLNSIAILPEGMSNERFDWLNNWVEDKKILLRQKELKVMLRKFMMLVMS